MKVCSVPDCERKHDAKGYCKPHYKQWRAGSPITKIGEREVRPRSLPETDLFAWILKNTDLSDPDGCWPCGFGSGDKGYPKFVWSKVWYRAHRWVHIYVNGHVDPLTPERPLTLHWCGNRRCVRPSHLRSGTPAENVADAQRHGTAPLAKCGTPSGIQRHRRKGEKPCGACRRH